MGEYANTPLQNIVSIIIVVSIIILSTMYGVSALFPNLFQ
jgi:hypothetical protein